MRTMDPGYPKPITIWKGIPDSPQGAFVDKENGSLVTLHDTALTRAHSYNWLVCLINTDQYSGFKINAIKINTNLLMLVTEEHFSTIQLDVVSTKDLFMSVGLFFFSTLYSILNTEQTHQVKLIKT